jgi:hypothetical protein
MASIPPLPTQDGSVPPERRPLLGDNANDSTYSAMASGTSTPKLFNSIGGKTAVKKPNIGKTRSKTYWSYYVPVFNWLPKYTPRLLFGDMVAGLTVSDHWLFLILLLDLLLTALRHDVALVSPHPAIDVVRVWTCETGPGQWYLQALLVCQWIHI